MSKREPLGDDGLSLNPQSIRDEFAWYYEAKRGVEVIHEIRDSAGEYIRTDTIVIPWKKLRASLDRYDTARSKEK